MKLTCKSDSSHYSFDEICAECGRKCWRSQNDGIEEGNWIVLTNKLFEDLVSAMNQSNILLIDTMLLKANGIILDPGPFYITNNVGSLTKMSEDIL